MIVINLKSNMVKQFNRLPIDKAHLHEFILWYRFHTLTPTSESMRFGTIKAVADLLNIGQTTVRNICRHYIKPSSVLGYSNMMSRKEKKNLLNKRQSFGELSYEHMDYLINEKTLIEWTGKSL